MTAEAIDRAAVEKVLKEFRDPESGRDLATMGQIGKIEIEGPRVAVEIGLTSWAAPIREQRRQTWEQQLRESLPAGADVNVSIGPHERPAEKIGQIGLTAKSVIAVGSGKGGVGKSTVAACLAYALSRSGSQVGLVDADVYGPSIPQLLGVEQRPEVAEQRIQPIKKDGLKVMSMGFLVPRGEAVVWRGPMLHGAITQFLRDTEWGQLDYLILDMPPGTGDIALTLSQLLPLTGAVVVCTPQQVALLDAEKAIAMFRKVNIPVLGMVENMSGFHCPKCGEKYDIFGSGGAKDSAAQLEVPFLGELPINIAIRTRGDSGETRALFDDEMTAAPLLAVAERLVANLAESRSDQPPLPTLSVL